jgi:hypothetical protein
LISAVVNGLAHGVSCYLLLNGLPLYMMAIVTGSGLPLMALLDMHQCPHSSMSLR